MSEARKQAEEALRNVERERLVSGIREAAKFASRSERMVFLHDYEAKALVRLIDATRSLLAEQDGAGLYEVCRDMIPAPSPASDAVREAAEIGWLYVERQRVNDSDCGSDDAEHCDRCERLQEIDLRLGDLAAALAARGERGE